MNKYEAMFIIKPDLAESERKILFNQISDAVNKNSGTVTQAAVWSEKRKMWFPIQKFHEAVYYLLNFTIDTQAVAKVRHIYKLNESILRVLITRT